jgi:DNA-binding FrmR family transcriptional regulator
MREEIDKRLNRIEGQIMQMNNTDDTKSVSVAVLQEQVGVLKAFQSTTGGLLSITGAHETRLAGQAADAARMEKRIDTLIATLIGLVLSVIGGVILLLIKGHLIL